VFYIRNSDEHRSNNFREARKLSSRNRLALLTASFCLTLALLVALVLPAMSQGKAAPIDQSFSGFKATVVGDVCNLRRGPGTSHEVVGQVVEGTWLDVLSVQGDWVKVSYKGNEVWIAAHLVDIDLGSRGVNARVTKTDVNIRSGPGTEFSVIALTQKDRVFPAQAKRGGWIRVSLGNSSVGWISEPLLQLEISVETPPAQTTTGAAADLLVHPSAGAVKVWQTPMQGSTLLARLETGESASYITSRGAFVAIETSAGIRGWVYGPEVQITSSRDPFLSCSVSDSSWSLGKYRKSTVTARDVNFRSGPGTSYPVLHMLDRGDVLRVIETRDQWIHAISPKGVAGWVASWLTSGVQSDPSSFSVTVDASLRSRTLTVTGPFESAAVIFEPDGSSLKISTSVFFNTEGSLDINCYEFESIKVATSDVTIKFREKPWYVVRENVPGRVVLEFAPAVTSIAMESKGDMDILTIHTLGYAWPDVTRNGSSVSFFLPGASYSGARVNLQGRLVQGIDVLPQNGGLALALHTSEGLPYLLKKTANTLSALFPTPGLAGKVIVVDPGHGGDDPGAQGPTGVTERVVNWEIAVRLADLLRKAGATVHLTRTGWDQNATPPSGWNPEPDEYAGDLAKRAAWSKNANIFISIHNDYHWDRTVSGTTSYVSSSTLNSAESKRLAELIQKELSGSLGTYDRGVKDANFFVTRESYCPSVLVEVMYLSCPREEALLRQEYVWEKAAFGLFSAIQKYFAAAQ